MEIPPGWVRRMLDRPEPVYSTLSAPPSGSVQFGDPYKLTRKGE